MDPNQIQAQDQEIDIDQIDFEKHEINNSTACANECKICCNYHHNLVINGQIKEVKFNSLNDNNNSNIFYD